MAKSSNNAAAPRKRPETESAKRVQKERYKVSLSVLCPDGSIIRYEQEEGDRRLASDCWEAFLAFERR